jgi:hypothetical protein
LVKIIMINLCLDLPQTDSFTVAVLHDQTWTIWWLPEAPLKCVLLDLIGLRPSQLSLAASKND